jgi:hypothetical protein
MINADLRSCFHATRSYQVKLDLVLLGSGKHAALQQAGNLSGRDKMEWRTAGGKTVEMSIAQSCFDARQ